jgi:STE24 endopeptidase
MASAVLTAALLIVVLVSGASQALAGWAVAVAAGSTAGAILLFVLPLLVLHDLLQFPVVFFRGVVLEHRYGLSRETGRQWLRDHVEGWLLRPAVTAGGAFVVVTSRMLWPDWWWLVAGAVFVLALVTLAQVAPVWLLPLAAAHSPLQRDGLVARLVALAERAGTHVLGVFEWHLAARTVKANAMLTGLGRTRRILVSDTLLAEHSDEEIEVILAHELAHHVHHDLWADLGVRALGLLSGAWLAHLVLDAETAFAATSLAGTLAGLPVVALSLGCAELAFGPVANALSRAHERRADRFALELTRNPDAFASALRKLASRNLTDDEPSRVVEFVFSTHPSAAARIADARRWAAERR